MNGWSVACSELSLFRAWLGTIERRYRCSVTLSLSLLCVSLPSVHCLPSGVKRTSVQGPYIQICDLYIWVSEWVSEGSCTAHSVAHSVTQGSFTWLTSGHKRWHLRKLLIAYRMEDFYKVASSKLKIVTTNGRNNMYLNLELITSNGNVMGLIPSGCMKWILNVKCINVKVEKNGRS